MIYVVIACVVGVASGYASVSRGLLFRGLSGGLIVTSCLLAQLGLSIGAGFVVSVWCGIATFLLSIFVSGKIGVYLYAAFGGRL